VTIGNNSHHVWFDHADVYDGSDGNLDITSGADFVTISWTKFHYTRLAPTRWPARPVTGSRISSARRHRADRRGHLNVTWHHNWWGDNVDQRMPRTRFGRNPRLQQPVHGRGQQLLHQRRLHDVGPGREQCLHGREKPALSGRERRHARARNLFQGTSGTTTATGTGFTPPYTYALDATAHSRPRSRARLAALAISRRRADRASRRRAGWFAVFAGARCGRGLNFASRLLTWRSSSAANPRAVL